MNGYAKAYKRRYSNSSTIAFFQLPSITGISMRRDNVPAFLNDVRISEVRMEDGEAGSASAREQLTDATKAINLALQGGGAHGAFAWGVIDRLLEDGRLVFEGISATSAGAMNATVLAYGLTTGGSSCAREMLSTFWRRISDAIVYSPLQRSPLDRFLDDHGLETSPAFMFFDLVTRIFSPYQFNPFNHNPLRDILEDTVDFVKLRRENVVKLFLCASNVRTGKIKVFENEEISSSAVLASGCLPFLFQAVEVAGEYYWDGGYMGNPAIFPLIYNCVCSDIVVVHLNPIERNDVPTNARDIINRVNEISFNSSFMREMRAIAFVTKLIDSGDLNSANMKRVLIHSIEAEALMQRLSVSSKMNGDWAFLTMLRDLGRKHAATWLKETFDRINHESTIDIRARFL